MRALQRLFLTLLFGLVTVSVTIRAQQPADTIVYEVSYVDVLPSARPAMIAALKQHRAASGKNNGFVRVDLLEQIGRPGHFVIVETWKDQNAIDARDSKPFRAQVEPIRLSGYDARLYKTLAVGASPAPAGSQAIFVVTHVDTIPGPQNDSPGLLRGLAEASRKDQGNVRFDILQQTARPNHFTVIETWQGQTALDAHAAAMHTKQYRDALLPMAGGPLDERLYKAVD